MPSNKDLIAKTLILATALSLDVKTDGLSNQQLADLVSDLHAKKRDADTVTQADTAAKLAKAVPGYSIAKGKALTSPRGILVAGDEIKPGDLAGGQDALDVFVKSGHVVKA